MRLDAVIAAVESGWKCQASRAPNLLQNFVLFEPVLKDNEH